MQRRRVLSLLAALAATTGCLGSAPPAGDDPGGETSSTSVDRTDTGKKPTATPTDDRETPTTTSPTDDRGPGVVDREFVSTDSCERPGGARVAFADDAVQVEGCIHGANGCTVAALDAATYDGRTDTLTVEVGTRDEGGEGVGCTQAIVDLGYRVRVRFDGDGPETVVVVHDGAYGRREVARAFR